MKHLICGFVVCIFVQNLQAKAVEYKSWKNFESEYGYSFKYPDCWTLGINDPEEEGKFSKIKNLYVHEDSCKTTEMDPEVPNAVGFTAFSNKTDKASRNKAISSLKKSIPFQLKNGEYLVTKTYLVGGGGEMIVYVESFGKPDLKIGWVAQLFCPERQISIGGASTKKPSKELLDKFKKGDLAIPEPYKTIFESVKCTKDKK